MSDQPKSPGVKLASGPFKTFDAPLYKAEVSDKTAQLLVFWELPEQIGSEMYLLDITVEEVRRFATVHARWIGGEDTTDEQLAILLDLEKRLQGAEHCYSSSDERLGRQHPIKITQPTVVIVCGRLLDDFSFPSCARCTSTSEENGRCTGCGALWHEVT